MHIYSFGTLRDAVDQNLFFEKREAAADIHAIRLAGLYVDNSEGSLNIPSKAVSPRQAAALIQMANALVEYAETQKPRDDIPREDLELQVWFLNAMDDPHLQRRILTRASLDKLKLLGSVREWSRAIKAELEAEDASLKELAERELRREPISDTRTRKERWKIRLKIETSSNSIRPAFIKKWNETVAWIKMSPVQGERKKDHLIVEFILGDDVPVGSLWSLGFTLAVRFVISINLATSGFWWWRQSPNKTKFYETIYDMENRCGLELDAGGFQVFERRAALTELHAQTLVACMAALPNDPHDPKRGKAYTAYLGGINFLAVNSIA